MNKTYEEIGPERHITYITVVAMTFHGSLAHNIDKASRQWDPKGKPLREFWWSKGLLHRTAGPALTDYFVTGEPFRVFEEKWYTNGNLHRAVDPAHMQYEYYHEVTNLKKKRFSKIKPLRVWYWNGIRLKTPPKEWFDKEVP